MSVADPLSGMQTPQRSIPAESPGPTTGSTILMVEHALGGGVQRHVRELVALFASRARLLVLAPGPGGLLRLSHGIPGLPPALYFDVRREFPALRQFLDSCGLSRIHFHATIQLPWEVAQLPFDLNVPYDFTAHDYFSFCPQITLTTQRFRYCGEPAEAGCNSCLAIRPTPIGESIESWRSRYRPFIEGAARVLVPVPSVAARLKKHFPKANLIVAPHPEASGNENLRAPQWRYKGGGAFRILVLGALNPTKGPDLLEAVALDAHARSLPLEFHLLGSAYRKLQSMPASALSIHGPYRDADLDRLIEELSPHLVWFPTQWPETYSYTLSAAIRLGLPAAAPDFGAFHDRLSGRPLSWLVPWDMEAPAWNDLFVRLGKDVCAGANYPVPGSTQPPVFSYDTNYLLRADPAKPVQTIRDLNLRAYKRSWRFNKEFLRGYLMSSVHRVLRRAYTLPAIHRIATSLVSEYRVQLFRRWLGRY